MDEEEILKFKISKLEEELKEKDLKLNDFQIKICELQDRLNDKTIELNQVKQKNKQTSTGTSSKERTLEREQTLERLKKKHLDVERLKAVVESLMVANEEKNNKIEELKEEVRRCKLQEEDKGVLESTLNNNEKPNAASTPFVLHQGFVVTGNNNNGNNLSNQELNSNGTNFYSNNLHKNRNNINNNSNHSLSKTPPTGKRQTVSITTTVTSGGTLPKDYHFHHQQTTSSSSHFSSPTSTLNSKPPLASSSSSSSISRINTSHTTTNITTNNNYNDNLKNNNNNKLKFSWDIKRNRTRSLVDGVREEAIKDELAQQYKNMQVNQPNVSDKRKGRAFKRLFNRLRRSTSQELFKNGQSTGQGASHPPPPTSSYFSGFRRSNQLRATAGPRVSAWTEGPTTASRVSNQRTPMSSWSVEKVSDWLAKIGMGAYIGQYKKWAFDGQHISTATNQELEKELGIKNHFHRRKIQLSIQLMSCHGDDPNNNNNMGHLEVQRWLDDIGLPQYKDSFLEASIDGNMLNYLTNEELQSLKVVNLLHQLSIRSGIFVLRKLTHFNISLLTRRPFPLASSTKNEGEEEGSGEMGEDKVCLWTNHRVMEWLRGIDLSEYAANLRGAGVHGALMVLEPRFTSELLASILSIPSNKSLLRRHLTTHFVALVGTQSQQMKRKVEDDPHSIPLTTNIKVKPSKKLNLFRPRTSDFKDDFVCPFDIKQLPWPQELPFFTFSSSSSSSLSTYTPHINDNINTNIQNNNNNNSFSTTSTTLMITNISNNNNNNLNNFNNANINNNITNRTPDVLKLNNANFVKNLPTSDV